VSLREVLRWHAHYHNTACFFIQQQQQAAMVVVVVWCFLSFVSRRRHCHCSSLKITPPQLRFYYF
jgi:hypothetical protein